MKKIIFTIFVFTLCSIGYIKAQAVDTIPNGSFARWKGLGQAKECPQGWDTLSGVSYPVTDVEYETQSLSANPQFNDRYVWDAGSKTALSLASTTSGGLIHFGYLYTKFPMKHRDPYIDMSLAYFEAVAPQTAAFTVIIWNSKTHDTLIKGEAYLPNAATTTGSGDTLLPWSPFSLQLSYSTTDTTTPDSGIIAIQNEVNVSGAANTAGSLLYIEKIWFANATASGIDPQEVTTSNTVSVYPNPFTNKTTIHYNLVQEGQVSLSIYDMQGREIKNLVNGNQSPGLYNETFDGSGLSNGVYMYRLETSSGVQTGKIILSR